MLSKLVILIRSGWPCGNPLSSPGPPTQLLILFRNNGNPLDTVNKTHVYSTTINANFYLFNSSLATTIIPFQLISKYLIEWTTS